MTEIETSFFQRHRRLIDLGVLGLLVVALGLLFFPRIAPPQGAAWKSGWNFLHVPGFFLITVAIYRLLGEFGPRTRECRNLRCFLAVGGGLVVAVSSELVHDRLGRSSEMGDLYRDVIGITLATMAIVTWPRTDVRGRAIVGVGMMLFLGFLLLPTLQGALAMKRQQARFPDLGGFESDDSLSVWQSQGNASVSRGRTGDRLMVEIGPGIYGGVSLWPMSHDWSAEEKLVLEIENPGEPFQLGLRIDDGLTPQNPPGSWWNGEEELVPGSNRIEIPLDGMMTGDGERNLELQRIRRLALFTGRESGDRVFFVVSAFLE